MPKSEFEKRREYLSWLRKSEGSLEKSKAFDEILTDIFTLLLYTDPLQNSDRPMREIEKMSITTAYERLIKNCNELIRNPENAYARQRRNLVQNILRIASKDYQFISTINKEKSPVYNDVIRQARAFKVDITDQEKFRTELTEANKLAMKTSNGTKGYFVPKEVNNYEADWFKAVDNCISKLPEQHRRFLTDLKTNPDKQTEFAYVVVNDKTKSADKDQQDYILANAAVALGMAEDYEAGLSFINSDENIRTALLDLASESNRLIPAHERFHNAGMTAGQRVDNRSAAMFEVAKLINCTDIIAKAAPMSVVNGEETIDGTFTEMPAGTDLTHLPENDPFFKCTDASFSAPAFVKQLHKLQVLDYICGNTERKPDNIIYDIRETSENLPAVARGIKAHGSDQAFGSYEYTDPQTMPFGKNIVHPSNMKYIDKTTAEAITALTPHLLKTVLMNYDLTEEQLEAAWKRTEAVQQAIKSNEIEILADEKWLTLDTDELQNTNYAGNLIAHLRSTAPLKKMAHDNARKSENYIPVTERRYDEAGLSGIRADLYLTNRQIQEMVEKMQTADKAANGSKEFNKMRDSLYSLGIASKRMTDNFKKGMLPDEKEIRHLDNLRNDLLKKSNAYMIAKGAFQRTNRGNERFNLANEISSVAGSLDDISAMSKDGDVQKWSRKTSLAAIEALIPLKAPLIAQHLRMLTEKANDIPEDKFENYMECLEYLAGTREKLTKQSREFFSKNLDLPEIINNPSYKQEMKNYVVPDTMDVRFDHEDPVKNTSRYALDAVFDSFENNNPGINREDFILIDGKSLKDYFKNNRTYESLDPEGKKLMIADAVDYALQNDKYVEVFCPERSDLLAHEPVSMTAKEAKANTKKILAARDKVRKEHQATVNQKAPQKNSLRNNLDKFKESIASELIDMHKVNKEIEKVSLSCDNMFFKGVDSNEYLTDAGVMRGRQTPSAICIGMLAAQGYPLDEILDPEQLVDKKEEAGKLYLQKRSENNLKWYAEVQVKGAKAINERVKDYIAKHKEELKNPETMSATAKAQFNFFKNLGMNFSQEAEAALNKDPNFFNEVPDANIKSADDAKKYFYSYQDVAQIGGYTTMAKTLMEMNNPLTMSADSLAEYQVHLIEEQLFLDELNKANMDLHKLEVPFNNHGNLKAAILETEEFQNLSDGKMKNTDKVQLLNDILSADFSNKYKLEERYLTTEDLSKNIQKEKEKEKEKEMEMELEKK